MKTPYKLAICVLSPLLLASIALGQQDYIGRYDLYAGYMYLNSPGLSLGESGFHTQFGTNPSKWYSMGFDFSTGAGNTSLTTGMMKSSVQEQISQQLAAFGLTLAVFAVVVLGLLVNVAAAALLALTIAFYVLVYTMWLKRSTPQNIVIGGAAGALPPAIGWAAATGGLAIEPIVLFLIIFFWTPPHFWALSLYRTEDYLRAGIPMLPVVAGEAETRRQILLYSLVLAPLGVAPWFLGYTGPLYAVVAIAAGAVIVALALRVRGEQSGHAASKQMFAFSILYLFLLFATLLVDWAAGGLFGRFAA